MLEEIGLHLRNNGIMAPLLLTSASAQPNMLPLTGSSLLLRETGGTRPEYLHNALGPAWARPTAQLVARADDPILARFLARQAYNVLVLIRNQLVGTVTYTATSISRSGTLVTVVTSAAHLLVPGMPITIGGATPSAYNGGWTITRVDNDTSFHFNISGSPLTPATGSMTATFLGTRYREVHVEQEPFDLGLDAAGLLRYAFNLTAVKEPS